MNESLDTVEKIGTSRIQNVLRIYHWKVGDGDPNDQIRIPIRFPLSKKDQERESLMTYMMHVARLIKSLKWRTLKDLKERIAGESFVTASLCWPNASTGLHSLQDIFLKDGPKEQVRYDSGVFERETVLQGNGLTAQMLHSPKEVPEGKLSKWDSKVNMEFQRLFT